MLSFDISSQMFIIFRYTVVVMLHLLIPGTEICFFEVGTIWNIAPPICDLWSMICDSGGPAKRNNQRIWTACYDWLGECSPCDDSLTEFSNCLWCKLQETAAWLVHWPPQPYLTPKELQSRFRDNPLKFRVFFPQLSPKRDYSPKRVNSNQ